jgi:hypothetical protein
MKIGNETRVCVKCKVEKPIFDYDIMWVQRDWKLSYLKRVCKKCDPLRTDIGTEKLELHKQLQKLNKKRLQLQVSIDNCQTSIEELLTGLQEMP